MGTKEGAETDGAEHELEEEEEEGYCHQDRLRLQLGKDSFSPLFPTVENDLACPTVSLLWKLFALGLCARLENVETLLVGIWPACLSTRYSGFFARMARLEGPRRRRSVHGLVE